MPEAARGKPIEVWRQDEARIGQQGTLTRVWAERGSRPRAPRDQRYKWACLFGATCPARGVGAAWVLPYANAKAMNLHLQEISSQVQDGAHAVVVLYGAGWRQTGGRLKTFAMDQAPQKSPLSCEGPRSTLRRAISSHCADSAHIRLLDGGLVSVACNGQVGMIARERGRNPVCVGRES